VAPSLSQVDGVFLPGERNPFAAYQRVAAASAPPGRARSGAATDLLTARGACSTT
jgi:hypothetical protein